MIFSPIRLGLFPTFVDIVHRGKEGKPNLLEMILAGLATGALGISIANPADLVKVRV